MTIVEVWSRSVVLVRDDQIVGEIEIPADGEIDIVLRVERRGGEPVVTEFEGVPIDD